MAKPPPVTRCRITCIKECAVEDLGPTMLKLSEAGFENISYDFYTDVKKFAQQTKHETSGHVRLAEWIKDHPTFKSKEVVDLFIAEGRTAGGAYSSITTLTKQKVLKALGEGQYSRTDVKALPSPKERPAKKPVKHDIPATAFTLRIMSRNHGRISSATLKKHFEADGRTANATGPVLSQLLKAKQIKRVAEGMYELEPVKAPKTNSKQKPEAVVVEVDTNG